MIEGLYIITDELIKPGRSHEEIVEAALAGGARIVQLRDKESSDDRLIRAGREIRRMTSEVGALFIVNDRLEVALACEADGLHIGQQDRLAGEIRPLLGNRMLGVSAATPEEAIRAREAGADYVGYGPVYATSTKQDAGSALGTDGIRAVRAACGLPVVAIGGINERNLAEIASAGADSAAVISAIVCADDMVEATRRLVRLWEESRGRT